jgi:predicted Zn-dependent peptidase
MMRVTRLANGFTVASDRMDSVETLSIGVWADVGTRNEPADINGVSHLLEHMAFKGTERRSAREIAEEIEAVGGHLNAYTAREQTAYYAKILAGDLPLAVDIIADILQHSTFDSEELARERAVVLQEIGQAEDTPDDIVFDHFQAAAFPDQPMGRPVLGKAEIVGSLSGETIRSYMRRHYAPGRLVLAAAGQVDHERLVDLARPRFVDLVESGPSAPEPARYIGGEIRVERDLEQVHVVLGLPGMGYLDPDYYALGLLSTLVGGGMSSRLFQEIREKRGLVYSIYSFASSFRDGGLFGVYAGTGEKEAAEILPLVIEELNRVPATVTEEELARARAQAKAGVQMARESTSNRAEQLATQLLIYNRPVPADEIVARIEAVDIAHLARIARRLTAGAPTLAALGPLGRLARLDQVAARLAA